MYCKNCGKEMNEYGICTNCGWQSSDAGQTVQIHKRKNTFPILFMISVILALGFCLIANLCYEISYESQDMVSLGGNVWLFLYGIVMIVPTYLLITRKNLRWCAVFLLAAALLWIVCMNCTNFNSVKVLYETERASNQDTWSQLQSEIYGDDYTDEQTEEMLIVGAFKVIYAVTSYIAAIPFLVLAAGIWLTKEKKVFKKVLIVSCVASIFCLVNFCPILFMGLSIWKDYDILQQQKRPSEMLGLK